MVVSGRSAESLLTELVDAEVRATTSGPAEGIVVWLPVDGTGSARTLAGDGGARWQPAGSLVGVAGPGTSGDETPDDARYPEGVDDLTETLAAAFGGATFSSHAVGDIMRYKYAKLLMNLGNALQALAGPDADTATAFGLLWTEARACFAAAGIGAASGEEDRARRSDLLTVSIETDFLNGEIVLLGRLHGVPTPANALVCALSIDAARRRLPAGSISAAELEARLSEAALSSQTRPGR